MSWSIADATQPTHTREEIEGYVDEAINLHLPKPASAFHEKIEKRLNGITSENFLHYIERAHPQLYSVGEKFYRDLRNFRIW